MTVPIKSTLVFYVNGKKVIDDDVDPEWTLLYYLRNKLRLCGTKLGCAEGGCGACTVMISKINRRDGRIIHLAVNACLAPVCMMHGLAVTTVEGIGSTKAKIHQVQERIAKSHGSQCGFCTPGIVMSMYALLRATQGNVTVQDIDTAFQGNLCRCTGYRPIIDGYKTFASKCCNAGDVCCKSKDNKKLFDFKSFEEFDETQEIIFPPELSLTDEYDNTSLFFKGENVSCYRPTSLSELIDLKSRQPDAKIVIGNSEVGIEMKFKNKMYPNIIVASMIRDLSIIKAEENGLRIGAGATLSDVERFLKDFTKENESSSCKILEAILDMLNYFAGKQIRNVASIGGNIMTGSPISDLNPILMAAGAQLEFQNKERRRELIMDDTFWTGYRTNISLPNEVLISVFLPFTTENQYFKFYKQSRRRHDDIAIVNAAFFVEIDKRIIRNITIAFGGMGPTTVLAKQTASSLIGSIWNDDLTNSAYSSLMSELTLDPNAPGGMIKYRHSLMLSLFFKFYLFVCNELNKSRHHCKLLDKHNGSSFKTEYKILSSSQMYQITPKEKTIYAHRPLVHQSAFKHATGEAVYCDDMPIFENETYMALVTSTRAHAKIKNIDASEALKLKGVLDFVSAKDIDPSRNKYGTVIKDEEIFASEKVICVGQIIGAIIGLNQIKAQRAAKLVKIEYEDLNPVIITIKDAMEHNSYFHSDPATILHGDPTQAFEESDGIITGELNIGGQEHFYLETHCCIVVPKMEDKELEIYSSTQHPSEVQELVSHALNIPANRIVSKTKRLGGGFGGKETRSSSLVLPAAIAAVKLKRPVRIMLDRDEDMVITGQRHPFYGTYKVGYNKSGKIKGCYINLYCNAGCSMDLSDNVMERAMFHVSNTCLFENIFCSGYVCRTNLPSNTAFRGFGAPQAMLFCENIIYHIAEKLNMAPEEVHLKNFYKPGDITHFKQQLSCCTIKECWDECILTSDYFERKEQVNVFNQTNKFCKRGISLIPTMFGIGFSTEFLNQAGVLILIYADGSVLISHGGTEMGQGLHTKMIQVASTELRIPPDKIHISETSTDKVPNTAPTAGSASSDLNGMAIIAACKELNRRLEPIKSSNRNKTWEDWIQLAYHERISLAATGFYKTEDLGFDESKGVGNVFNYFTYGVACSEVEIDCLTGDHEVLRTDIVMDLGQSLNPAIDIGQIEGAFMQGYGLFTLEELVYNEKGELLTRGPGTYKIPGFSDIPKVFNVSLLKGSYNTRAVYSSKSVGEPPLFLASSVFFAIREAVKCARQDNDINGWFAFDSPATAEQIRTACLDRIMTKCGL